MSDLKQLLKDHGLKFTENRRAILEVFKSSEYALAYSDLDSSLKSKLDKVTVYRTLKSFEESGIIHEVLDGSSHVKYALCHSGSCSSHDHHDSHVHFKCDKCEKTFCLDEVKVPQITLPQGYTSASQSIFVNGVCTACN